MIPFFSHHAPHGLTTPKARQADAEGQLRDRTPMPTVQKKARSDTISFAEHHAAAATGQAHTNAYFRSRSRVATTLSLALEAALLLLASTYFIELKSIVFECYMPPVVGVALAAVPPVIIPPVCLLMFKYNCGDLLGMPRNVRDEGSHSGSTAGIDFLHVPQGMKVRRVLLLKDIQQAPY